MKSKQKNLLKEIKKHDQSEEQLSDNNKVDLKIKMHNDKDEQNKENEENENESEYENEEGEEEEDDEEEIKEEIKEEKKEEDIISKKSNNQNDKELNVKNDNSEENNNNKEENENKNENENEDVNANKAINENNIDNNNNKEQDNNKDGNKSRQKVKPPTITKFNMTKSSSVNDFDSNTNKNNQIFQLNFQAEEIRPNDIYENKIKKEKNIDNKKIKSCYKCGNTNINEITSVTFSCNHIICFNCIIKDLILLQFKNIENKDIIQLNCCCMVGASPEMEFDEILEKIKYINNKKEEKYKCNQHKKEGLKYCKDCELWLCEECINIHSIFNKSHSLTIKSIPLKKKCQIHNNEFTQYYCLNCKEEICPFCLTITGKHREHKSLKFDKLVDLAEEIKSNLIFKTYDECLENLERIKENNKYEKDKKIIIFKEEINNLINKINIIQDNYIKKINDKINYLNQVVDIMEECYKYFYLMLSNEKKDFNDLNFMRQIKEIYDIKTFYNNDITKAAKIIDNFNLNDVFSYNIKIISQHQFSFDFEKVFRNRFLNNNINLKSLTIQSKYNINPIKYKEIKYERSIKTQIGAIYAIIKINNDEIAVACGKEILIINNINSNKKELLYQNLNNPYPSLKGHTKSILCLSLILNDKLASGSEDKSIKIWDIENKKCIDTIKGDFQRIDSLLSFHNDILIVGSHNIIKIINVENKEELYTLIGHEKSICSIIQINENLLASSSYDNTIKIWNIDNNKCEYTLYGHDSPVFCILLLKDGRLISGSGSWNKSLKIWNLEKKICECTLIGHKREIRDIKQLSNGWIITASMDKTIKVWNIYKKICIQTLISHYDIIFSLCIINKNKFVSGGRDQDIIIWKC